MGTFNNFFQNINQSNVSLGKKSFPDNLGAWLCSRTHIEMFTKEAKEIGVEVLGQLDFCIKLDNYNYIQIF